MFFVDKAVEDGDKSWGIGIYCQKEKEGELYSFPSLLFIYSI
ncbi:hypothetical protein DESME_00970 [Desulfitobacterium metallireducens DSM 15288]|uniref:Uncharacterized protein n=1 Tax=Desulfitobacterium metallireducens DSM 15288 TaxID=871968 RepID=W0EH28_9FIRM|nr:hypothetical protein DESME_00970 [Desulfitobacterium metallireducens DSM 15288]